MAENWHALLPAETLAKLESRSSGITIAEVRARFIKYGPNSLEEKAGKSASMVFVG